MHRRLTPYSVGLCVWLFFLPLASRAEHVFIADQDGLHQFNEAWQEVGMLDLEFFAGWLAYDGQDSLYLAGGNKIGGYQIGRYDLWSRELSLYATVERQVNSIAADPSGLVFAAVDQGGLICVGPDGNVAEARIYANRVHAVGNSEVLVSSGRGIHRYRCDTSLGQLKEVDFLEIRGFHWIADLDSQGTYYEHTVLKPEGRHLIRPIDDSGNELPGKVFTVEGIFGGMHFNRQDELYYVDIFSGALNRAAWEADDGSTGSQERVIGGLRPSLDFAFVPSLSERLDFDDSGHFDLDDVNVFYDAVDHGTENRWLDLDRNARVDDEDLYLYVTQVIGSPPGDADLDHSFDVDDLMAAFTAGEYEDGMLRNSTWGTGDWTGDREFMTDDLVAALQAGGYTERAAPAAPLVPEPSTAALAAWISLLLLGYFRRSHF